MKINRRHLCIMAALSLSVVITGVSFGQLPISKTQGVLAAELPAGKVTYLGLPFTRSPIARVTVSAAAGLSITVAGTPFTVGAFATAPHSAVLVGGANDGMSFKITTNTANGLTLSSAVPAGIAANSIEVLVVPDWTLGTLFATALSSGDKVTVEDDGVLTDYTYTGSWGTNANVRIPNQRGVIVTRVAGTDLDLVHNGVVRSGTQRMITNPAKVAIFSNPFGAPLTLASSGLRTAVVATSAVSTADKVSIENAGVVTDYYLSPTGWKAVVGNAVSDNVAIPAGKSVRIQRGGGTPTYPPGWQPGRPRRYFQPVKAQPPLTWRALEPFAS